MQFYCFLRSVQRIRSISIKLISLKNKKCKYSQIPTHANYFQCKV